MTVPSTNASIPSKYQVFFTSHNEKKGFTCQAPRFTSASADVSAGVSVSECECAGVYECGCVCVGVYECGCCVCLCV